MLGYGKPSEMKTGAASSCMMLTCCLRMTTIPTPATSSSPHTCLWPWTSSDTGRSMVCMCAWMDFYRNVLCWDIIFKIVHWWCDPPRLPYPQYFGGVSAVTPDQYMKMNGFPNQYWGWGGEDDDIAARWGEGEWGRGPHPCMMSCEVCSSVSASELHAWPFQPLRFIHLFSHVYSFLPHVFLMFDFCFKYDQCSW